MFFNFGNKKPNIKQYAIMGLVLSSIIALLSQCTGVNQNIIWDLFDEIQRKYFLKTPTNDFILQDPEKLKRRIDRDINRAIESVSAEYDRIIREADRRYKPRYVDEKNDENVCYSDECKALAPPMRICAPWVDTCPKD